MLGCSTPRGVFVGFGRVGAGDGDPDGLLNASRRLRRVRVPPRSARAPTSSCSTPRGVFVGFGRRSSGPTRRRRAAQRLAASSSGSGLIARRQRLREPLLNASRRLRRVRRGLPGGLHGRLLNASRRLRRVRTGMRRNERDPRLLLNASRRHRRVRLMSAAASRQGSCSTPRGVFVGFGETMRRAERGLPASAQRPRGVFVGFGRCITWPSHRRLNASRRLRRVRGVFVGFGRDGGSRGRGSPAQRLAASSSGSVAAHESAARPIGFCSTPRGVFVGFGGRRSARPRDVAFLLNASRRLRRVRTRSARSRSPISSAQRLAASSSGSGGRRLIDRRPATSAQRLAASSSGSEPPRKWREGRPLREDGSTTPGLGPARADTEIPFRPSPWPKPRTGRGMR